MSEEFVTVHESTTKITGEVIAENRQTVVLKKILREIDHTIDQLNAARSQVSSEYEKIYAALSLLLERKSEIEAVL